MSKRLGVLLVMLVLLALPAIVSAAEQQDSGIGNGGYIVTPSQDTSLDLMSIKSISSTITQGATNWHTKTVSSTITSLNVDLNWGNSANSLRLTIYSPDGYTFGPYTDSSDGTVNGRINLYISNTAGIATGTWTYQVYGQSVSGTQAYSI